MGLYVEHLSTIDFIDKKSPHDATANDGWARTVLRLKNSRWPLRYPRGLKTIAGCHWGNQNASLKTKYSERKIEWISYLNLELTQYGADTVWSWHSMELTQYGADTEWSHTIFVRQHFANIPRRVTSTSKPSVWLQTRCASRKDSASPQMLVGLV